jgi:hypothetical protein
VLLGVKMLTGSNLTSTIGGSLNKIMGSMTGIMAMFGGGAALNGLLGGGNQNPLINGAGVGIDKVGQTLTDAFLPFGRQSAVRDAFNMNRSQGGPGNLVARLPKNASFEQLLMAFMSDYAQDHMDRMKSKMDEMRKRDQAAAGGNGGTGAVKSATSTGDNPVANGTQGNDQKGKESSSIDMQELQFQNQELQQYMQMISAMVKSVGDTASTIIRHIS